MNPLGKSIWSLFAVAALLQLAGCASFEFTKAPPAQTQPVTIKTSGEELSGWTDLPIGVYRVPDSHVIISGHQKGHAAGLMFGLIGVAVAHAANASAGESAVKTAEQQLRIKLTEPVNAALARLVQTQPYSRHLTLAEKPGQPALVITPALVLSYVTDNSIRPYVVLKASMLAADGKPQWTTRYIASSGQPRTLLGTDGWMLDDAAELRKTIAENLERAIRTLGNDLAKPYPRDDSRLTMVQSHFPYLKQRLQAVGYQLDEDEAHLTFIPKLGDALVFSGVNILDKRFITHRPATKDDAIFKLVD